jgi:hypothetical protein
VTRDDEKVSAVLTQLPWTHNLIILGAFEEMWRGFVRSTLECGGKATALGGRWNRDDSPRAMLATSFAIVAIRSLDRAIQFCQCFPEEKIVSTLSTQLSWSHFGEAIEHARQQAPRRLPSSEGRQ